MLPIELNHLLLELRLAKTSIVRLSLKQVLLVKDVVATSLPLLARLESLLLTTATLIVLLGMRIDLLWSFGTLVLATALRNYLIDYLPLHFVNATFLSTRRLMDVNVDVDVTVADEYWLLLLLLLNLILVDVLHEVFLVLFVLVRWNTAL